MHNNYNKKHAQNKKNKQLKINIKHETIKNISK